MEYPWFSCFQVWNKASIILPLSTSHLSYPQSKSLSLFSKVLSLWKLPGLETVEINAVSDPLVNIQHHVHRPFWVIPTAWHTRGSHLYENHLRSFLLFLFNLSYKSFTEFLLQSFCRHGFCKFILFKDFQQFFITRGKQNPISYLWMILNKYIKIWPTSNRLCGRKNIKKHEMLSQVFCKDTVMWKNSSKMCYKERKYRWMWLRVQAGSRIECCS